MENTKKGRNYVVPWLFCSIVAVISIFYLFSPENLISGQLEVTTRSLLTISNIAKASRKRQVDVKPKVTRKIWNYKTVEQTKISKNKTFEPSKNKKVKPSDESEYQSEYTYNCHTTI